MNKNPYDDTSISWLPQPSIDRNRSASLLAHQQTQMRVQASPKATSTKQARMPKQKALEVASFLKKGIAVTSILSFGMFAWLAGNHTVGTTTSKTTSSGNSQTVATPSTSSSSTSTQSGSSDSSQSNSSSSTSVQSGSDDSSNTQSNGNGFFNQGGGSSVGSSSSSSAVSGTSAS